MKNKRKFKSLARAAATLRALIFPSVCVSCRQSLPISSSARGDASYASACLCGGCMSDFAASVREMCGQCGESYAVCECVPDALRSVGAERAYSCFAYEKERRNSAASAVLFKLKGGQSSDVMHFCAELLARRLEKAAFSAGFDLQNYTVTYAPRRKRAIRENGCDHMARTAKMTAELIGISYEATLVNTASGEQKKKNASSRLASAEASIRLRKKASESVCGKRYILIDDILTSGATLAACASRLYGAGAEDVILCTLAKTASRQLGR